MNVSYQTLEHEGHRIVLIDEGTFVEILEAIQRLPALPPADEAGTRDALPFARVSIARSIIQQRRDLGWSQSELARRAGVNVETLNRIEKGHVTAATATIAKLDRALQRGRKRARGTGVKDRTADDLLHILHTHGFKVHRGRKGSTPALMASMEVLLELSKRQRRRLAQLSGQKGTRGAA